MRGISKWMVLSCLLAGGPLGGAEPAAAEAQAEITGRVIDGETGEPAAGKGAPGQICGEVTDRETGQPVSGALVGIDRKGRRAREAATGRDGAFCLDEVAPGGMRLTVSLMGYSSHVEEVTLAPGAALDLEIALRSDPIQLAPVEIIGESPLANRKRTGTGVEADAAGGGAHPARGHAGAPRARARDQRLRRRRLRQLAPEHRHPGPEPPPQLAGTDSGGRRADPAGGLRLSPMPTTTRRRSASTPWRWSRGARPSASAPRPWAASSTNTTRRPDGTRGMVNQLAAGGNSYYSVYSEWRGLGGGRTASDAQLLYKHGDGFRDNNTFDQLNGTVKTQPPPERPEGALSEAERESRELQRHLHGA